MILRFVIILLIIYFLQPCAILLAQSLPISFYSELPSLSEVVNIDSKHNNTLKFSKNQFAIPVSSQFDICNSGEWCTIDNKNIWRLCIEVDNASSVNFLLSDFFLPKDAELFVYSADSMQVYGPFTSEYNADWLPIPPINAGIVVFEYSEPLTPDFTSPFCIKQINVEPLNSHHIAAKAEATCHVDFDSELFAEWQDIRRSVCKIIVGGTTICSGVLLASTDNSFTPYVLTARHCISSEKMAQNSIFYFNYDPDSINNRYVIGASLVATKHDVNGLLDFSLLQLNSAIPSDYNVFYAGWDVAQPTDSQAVCIHHPNGMAPQVALTKSPLRIDSYLLYDDSTFFNVVEWERGATEIGSSGAPLFNANRNVIGILSGGDSSCDYPKDDYFQMFSACYNKYDDDDEQLMYWLNPTKKAITKLDGSYYNKAVEIVDKMVDTTILVHPNPAYDKIVISSSEFAINCVIMTNISGLGRVEYLYNNQQKVIINIANMPCGVYVCQVFISNGSIVKKLIVKQ